MNTHETRFAPQFSIKERENQFRVTIVSRPTSMLRNEQGHSRNLGTYINEFAKAKSRIRNELNVMLSESKIESEMNSEEFRPLASEAGLACQRLINFFAEKCFLAESISSVALARLNGGATLACRNNKNKRRIDVEIEPSGETSEFIATEEARTISDFQFDLNKEIFEAWLDWVLGIE